jgi:phosphoribosylanthranilate isomerase
LTSLSSPLQIKICGICDPEQGQAIALMGATALGFICVPSSPRYVTPEQIQSVIATLPAGIDCVGVFADAKREAIAQVLDRAALTSLQLHGQETPAYCQNLGQRYPEIRLIKALRVRSLQTLELVSSYRPVVDSLLLDAYHPQQLGGTGQVVDWQLLSDFEPPLPWFLAGGLTPDNVVEALNRVHPSGIDLSSGVERSPGDKDLKEVARLFATLQHWQGERLGGRRE